MHTGLNLVLKKLECTRFLSMMYKEAMYKEAKCFRGKIKMYTSPQAWDLKGWNALKEETKMHTTPQTWGLKRQSDLGGEVRMHVTSKAWGSKGTKCFRGRGLNAHIPSWGLFYFCLLTFLILWFNFNYHYIMSYK